MPPIRNATVRLLISGYFGEGNVGDDLLLARIAERCRTIVPDAHLVATWGSQSPWPAPTTETITRDPGAVVAHLDVVDAVIVGPGGLFHNARLAGKPHRDRGLLALDRVTASAAERGLPLAAVGIGLGPLAGPTAKQATARILDRCHSVTVRDDRSFALASRLTATAVAVTPDLAIAASPSAGSPTPGTVAVNLRPWGSTRSAQARLEQLKHTIDQLRDEGAFDHVIGVPLSVSTHEAIDDRRAIEPLLEALSGVETSLLDPQSPEEVEDALGSAESVIAMRLHGAVLARNRQIPCAALAYDTKVIEVAEPIGASAVPLSARSSDILRALDRSRARAGEWISPALFGAVDVQVRSLTSSAEHAETPSTPTLSALESWRIALGA